jgi:hypothetical protein
VVKACLAAEHVVEEAKMKSVFHVDIDLLRWYFDKNDDNAYKNHPIHFSLWCIKYCLINGIKRSFRSFFRLFAMPQIVNTGMGWQGLNGWFEIEDLMFHACFSLLGRFVEQQLGPITIDDAWNYGENEKVHHLGYRLHSTCKEDITAVDLWLWYKHDRPKEHKDYWANDARWSAVGNALVEKDDAKLKELMNIRRSLWT